ncbi:hypothetical protein JI735_33155 [Paenibacillus sonchi]|uniref:Uncharacterized protein n=1 Tax=Paenibacillus sonchi TaxID=373687 RepID=A0A974PCC4_9BACL|nr:hypothetical protein [Paenibacillus sonchi]QQZ61171.1 hypothetical protein JI735_33155 [Paenibacillus sonchi]
MSWEIVRESKEPCGCGLGFVLTVVRSDDWNRTDETISLQCSECVKNYVRYSYDYQRSGMIETATYWVKKEDYKAFLQSKSEVDALQVIANKDLTEYLRLHYLKPWMDLFSDVPWNKKSIWSKLKLLGLTSYSYSTFSGKIKVKDLTEFVESFVTYSSVNQITKILSINDNNIETIALSTQSVRQRYEEARKVMMGNAFS